MADQRINPYLPGNPVKPVHFAGRSAEIAELRAKLAAAQKGYPISIFVQGEWGIGKTSLLKKLHPEFSEHGLVIREDVPEGSAATQIRALYPAILQDLKAATGVAIEADSEINYEQPRTLRVLLTKLISALWEQKSLLTIIVLDNLERAAPEFLAGIKDVFQRVGEDAPHFMLVFAGKSLPGAGEHASDPLARFFQTIPVGPMNADEGLEAIFKPIELDPDFRIDEDAARLVHGQSAGHPYFLKQICSHVFQCAEGSGKIDREWLEGHWGEVEAGLENTRFRSELADLPKTELTTLMSGSLHGVEFPRSAIAGLKESSLDSALRRLTKERGLLKSAARGVYAFYHPLFHAFVLAKAYAEGLEVPCEPTGSLEDLIAQGESSILEFKETLQYNVHTKIKDNGRSDAVLKTIAAFHNTGGGTLLIGVADDGSVRGLDRDLSLRPAEKRNDDQFTLTLQDLVRDRLTPRRPNRVGVRIEGLPDGRVCIVEVPARAEVTYFDNKLFVRDGPRSIELVGDEMAQFIRERDQD
ncbi:MAG: putative DNA binding domain-containing protein [Krumholzibacteria bacterium]|nr:putative DNA binding domain-containing protein [Candidatus Krumholzibacteria bacterium]